jgi:hypothetical protein
MAMTMKNTFLWDVMFSMQVDRGQRCSERLALYLSTSLRGVTFRNESRQQFKTSVTESAVF